MEEAGPDAAEAAYANALRYLDAEEEIKASFFFRVHDYYLRRERFEDALEVMRKGAEYLPDNARIRLAAAALYEKIGIDYRAAEEYEKALVLKGKGSGLHN